MDVGCCKHVVVVVLSKPCHPITRRSADQVHHIVAKSRNAWRTGVRSTKELGYRSKAQALEAQRREVNEIRYTSLDRMIARASTGTDTGTHFPVAARTLSASGSPGLRGRSRAWRCAHADARTRAHNTLSTDSPDVQVFYPFHPLHGVTLQILRRPKRADGAVCVIDPTGRRLKIPAWMLSRDCAEIQIAERPQLSKGALLSLAPLITSQIDSKDHVHDNLLQTAVDGCKGGRRGAITISGPDDPKERLGRATGRSDTRRSDRSHGPRGTPGRS